MFLKILIQSAILLVLSAIAGCVTSKVHPHAPAFFLVKDATSDYAVSMKQVEEEWGGDVLWIDARPDADFQRGHLPNALSLNHEHYNELIYEHFETIASETRPVVVYCDGESCGRSRKIAEALRNELALENVYYLKGGWNG